MKKDYLITYELNNKTKDYSILYNAIKTAGDTWWHYIDSTWIIKNCRFTGVELQNRLLSYIDADIDWLLVIEITLDNRKNSVGWLPKDAWEWLKEEKK